MEKTGRLTLAELKAKADVMEKNVAIEKVRGGNWADCHDCPTTWDKIKDYWYEAMEH